METIKITEQIDAVVTQMRQGDAFGNGNEELQDGNKIPRLCAYAGEQSCAVACQFKADKLALETSDTDATAVRRVATVGKLCAEQNILNTLDQLHVNAENCVLVSATKDRVIFADEIDDSGAKRHNDRYTLVPEANGFYFRPGVDTTPGRHRRIYEAAMRMADCGDVVITGTDKKGQLLIGQSHFSRTNMFGSSRFKHELNGEKVSWGEYVIGRGLEHYGIDVKDLQIKLVAAVNDADFIHYFESDAKRDEYFAGWNELGFMHPIGTKDHKGRDGYLINYRDMIVWQLTEGVKNPKYRLSPEQIQIEQAINTGAISLGHASHQKASAGEIAHGRDLYIVGLNKREAIEARIEELDTLQAGRKWTMRTFVEMSDDDYDTFAKLYADGNRELTKLMAALQELPEE